jgi:hypothetical protein
MRTPTWEADPEKQKELFDKVNQETIQPHLEKVEQHLIKNGSGHLVGKEVSSIDFLEKQTFFQSKLKILLLLYLVNLG